MKMRFTLSHVSHKVDIYHCNKVFLYSTRASINRDIFNLLTYYPNSHVCSQDAPGNGCKSSSHNGVDF